MSIILWEDEWFLECPHCKKIIRMESQESESYGVSSWISTDQTKLPTRKSIEKHNKKVHKEGGVLIELKRIEDLM